MYLVYINGELVPAEEAKVSVFDAAFLYGEGLFETLAAQNGYVHCLDDHLRRLKNGAKALGLPLHKTASELTHAVYTTLHVNRLKDAYIRINLSAEEGGVGIRKRRRSDLHLVIFVKPSEPYPKKLYRNGCRLVVIKSVTNDPAWLAGLKTTSYLTKMIARREVVQRKADEGILLNPNGRVAECAGSNIFIVTNGRLITPPIEEGIMPGVTRKWVLNLARRMPIPTREQKVTLKMLDSADEIFVTSTLKKVMPVLAIDHKRVAKRVPGPVTGRLAGDYQTLLATNSSRKRLAF